MIPGETPESGYPQNDPLTPVAPGELGAQLRNEPNESANSAPPNLVPEVPYRRSWQSRLLGISFAIFAFEIGLFLVIFPWMGDAWEVNYFQSGLILRNLWDEPYFRGAVSGIGFINIYIALLQIVRLFRRSA
jgi:hypothetical protein